MKEAELELLGFKKEYTDEPNVYYYVYDFVGQTEEKTHLCMITNECSDQLDKNKGEWSVSFFDSDSLIYRTYSQVKKIIYAIENVSVD
jgi:hypothetical protein